MTRRFLLIPSLVTVTGIACDGSLRAPAIDGDRPDAASVRDAPPPASPPPYLPTEGTRLKARWFEGPDGQRSLDALYDTQLHSSCFFSRAADGELRCLPVAHWLSDDPDFADAACTEPVVWARQSCPGPVFVYHWNTSNACDLRDEIFRVGAAIPDGRTYYRNWAGECVSAGAVPGYVPHRVGEEVPPTAFVRGRLTSDPPKAGQALQLVVLEAEDGAKVDQFFRNAEAGHDCALVLLDDGRVHCVPPSATISSFTFADAGCGHPAVSTNPTCGPPPALARRRITAEVAPGVCGEISAMHELGPVLDPPYTGRPGMCRAALSTSPLVYRDLGPPIAPDRFVALDQIVEPSGHALWPARLVAPGGGPAVTDGWFDGQRNARCFPARIGGKHRCVPDTERLAGFFADEQCTRPLLRATAGACLPGFAHDVEDGSCPPDVRIYAVGARHAGVVHEQYLPDDQDAPACRFSIAVAPTDVFHELTPVAGDQFPELKLIDPAAR